MDDTDRPPRMAFVVTADRVQHYDGVIDYMVTAEIARCKEKEGFTPTTAQINFYKKELTRYMTLRRDVSTAQTIHIKKSNVLNETSRISSRS